MYAVHLIAVDKAENQKPSRKLVLFDNISRVSTLPNKVTRIETAAASTNYSWVIEDTNIIRAKWTERFRNSRHESNRWLTPVSSSPGIEDLYDDHHGKRTVDEVPNIYGLSFFNNTIKLMYLLLRDSSILENLRLFKRLCGFLGIIHCKRWQNCEGFSGL